MTAVYRPVTYGCIRKAHFRKSLAAVVQGLDKATIALVCVFGSGSILLFAGLLMCISACLAPLTDPSSLFSSRIFAVVLWQAVTFGLLWAMRNLLFMRHADAFFASLPISRRTVLGMDIAIAMKCCSLLWLPILWLLGKSIVARPAAEGIFAFLSLGIPTFSGLVSNVLALRRSYVPAAAALLPSMAITAFMPLSISGILAGVGSAVLAFVVIEKCVGNCKFEHSSRSAGRHLFDQLAIASGTTLPFLAHNLRETATVRAMVIIAAFGTAFFLVHRYGPGPRIAMATMTCLCALLTTLLYRLPSMTRRAVCERMGFLAGQPDFRRRVRAYAVAVPSIFFVIAVMFAYVFVSIEVSGSSTVGPDLLAPISIFTSLYVLGVLGSLNGLKFVTWCMPVANLAVALVILMSQFS